MKKTDGRAAFLSAAEKLSEPMRTRLITAAENRIENIREIRLIEGVPLQIMAENRIVTLGGERLTSEQLAESLISLCENSVHSHQRELAQGYITIKGGHRAGISATAVYDEKDRLTGLRQPTAIVLRVAGRFENVSDELIKQAFSRGICGLLIAGAPGSGKTTMLRDIAKKLSAGTLQGCERVAVVDERGELYGFCGAACVMSGYKKAEGILMAVRNLSPQLVICDELGSEEEINAVKQVMNSGVSVITSVHAANRSELVRKEPIIRLLKSGAFLKTAFISCLPNPCTLEEVTDSELILAQERRLYSDNCGSVYERRG